MSSNPSNERFILMGRIKQKCIKIKNKIKEHQDEILLAVALTEAMVGVGSAFYYQKKYFKTKRQLHAVVAHESRCHANAAMLYHNTAEGTKTMIGVKDDHYVVMAKGLPMDD